MNCPLLKTTIKGTQGVESHRTHNRGSYPPVVLALTAESPVKHIAIRPTLVSLRANITHYITLTSLSAYYSYLVNNIVLKADIVTIYSTLQILLVH